MVGSLARQGASCRLMTRLEIGASDQMTKVLSSMRGLWTLSRLTVGRQIWKLIDLVEAGLVHRYLLVRPPPELALHLDLGYCCLPDWMIRHYDEVAGWVAELTDWHMRSEPKLR